MTDLVRLIITLIPAQFLIFAPFICLSDIMKRELDYVDWVPLALWGFPATIYMYITRQYPVESLIVTCITVTFLYIVYIKRIIHGGDFIYLTLILTSWIVNPWPVPHGPMQIPFLIFLTVTLLITALVVLIVNYFKGYRWGIIEMMQSWPGGVPMTIPITFAFILSLVIG